MYVHVRFKVVIFILALTDRGKTPLNASAYLPKNGVIASRLVKTTQDDTEEGLSDQDTSHVKEGTCTHLNFSSTCLP